MASRTLERQLSASDYIEDVKGPVSLEQQSAFATLYFPYRNQLLTEKTRSLLQSGNSQQLQNDAIAAVYNPFAPTGVLTHDPYQLLQRFTQGQAKPALTLKDNWLTREHQGRHFILLRATLADDPFSLATQAAITEQLERFRQLQPDVELLATGTVLYAAAGSDSARREISTIGLGSLLGILLLIALCFRALTPFILCLISIGAGVIAATLATCLVFGSIHLFALIFGASLTGVSIDYAFHFFADQYHHGPAWQPRRGLRRIRSGIILGLITSIIGYGAMGVTPFPGLQQLALFSITGLLVAFACVFLLFPKVLAPVSANKQWRLQKITGPLLSRWFKLAGFACTTRLSLIFILLLLCLPWVSSNDDIRALQPVDASLQQQEKKIRALLGRSADTAFILITAQSNRELLEREWQLLTQLQKLPGTQTLRLSGLTEHVPPADVQQRDAILVRETLYEPHYPELRTLLGVPTDQRLPIDLALELPFTPLTLSAWLESPASIGTRQQWLATDYGVASVLLLEAGSDHQLLQQVSEQLPGVLFIDRADEISDILARYRDRITALLAGAYGLIFLVLMRRYGAAHGWRVILPPLVAALCAIAINIPLGQPINLFHLLALLLVLGIGIDYTLFFAESALSEQQATASAILLSALTSILSFGLLALSSTPAISGFGRTVWIGIAIACILAPIAGGAKRAKPFNPVTPTVKGIDP